MRLEICYIINWGFHIIAMGLITTRVAHAKTLVLFKSLDSSKPASKENTIECKNNEREPTRNSSTRSLNTI